MWVLLLGSEQSECKCAQCVPMHSSIIVVQISGHCDYQRSNNSLDSV